jgi:hypothetical protein
MRSRNIAFIAGVLVASLALMPAGLAAQERRGSDLVVTKSDGIRISGELIAVKADSLLLLSGGLDVSVPQAEIGSVRIVRRSPLGILTVAGLLLGSGAVGMTTEPNEEWGWVYPMLAGIGGSIVGLVGGLIADKDTVIVWRKDPGGVPAYALERLRRSSREGRAGTDPGPARRKRFRITLATTMRPFNGGWRSRSEEVVWRFTEAVPPEEAGPYRTLFTFANNPGEEFASPGPLSLGYAWTERWGAEVELSLWRKPLPAHANVYPDFISTEDGRLYQAYIFDRQQAGYDQFLAGLVYRPVVPSARHKTTLEIGVSAGPARFNVTSTEGIVAVGRKTVLAGQVRLSYDYSFKPGFFLGFYGAYLWSEASFAEATVTRDLEFTHWESGGDPVEPITRRVEMILPAREYSRTGLVYGLRIGFRL